MAQDRDDIPGTIGDLMRLGVIASVDLASATIIVDADEIATPPCPWFEISGGFRVWVPPVVGEQVLLLCPEGDIAHAIALRGLRSNAFPAPANDGRARFLMPDGSTIDYDPEIHELTITLNGGKLTIIAPEGVTITGDVAIDGKLDVTGEIATPEDVKADGKSLKSHKHISVQPGSGVSGEPQ
jgi:phage baseplate assembly protein V